MENINIKLAILFLIMVIVSSCNTARPSTHDFSENNFYFAGMSFVYHEDQNREYYPYVTYSKYETMFIEEQSAKNTSLVFSVYDSYAMIDPQELHREAGKILGSGTQNEIVDILKIYYKDRSPIILVLVSPIFGADDADEVLFVYKTDIDNVFFLVSQKILAIAANPGKVAKPSMIEATPVGFAGEVSTHIDLHLLIKLFETMFDMRADLVESMSNMLSGTWEYVEGPIIEQLPTDPYDIVKTSYDELEKTGVFISFIDDHYQIYNNAGRIIAQGNFKWGRKTGIINYIFITPTDGEKQEFILEFSYDREYMRWTSEKNNGRKIYQLIKRGEGEELFPDGGEEFTYTGDKSDSNNNTEEGQLLIGGEPVTSYEYCEKVVTISLSEIQILLDRNQKNLGIDNVSVGHDEQNITIIAKVTGRKVELNAWISAVETTAVQMQYHYYGEDDVFVDTEGKDFATHILQKIVDYIEEKFGQGYTILSASTSPSGFYYQINSVCGEDESTNFDSTGSSSSLLEIPPCPGSLPTQIYQLGMIIRVTTNGLVPQLGIRPEPTLDSNKIYTLPSGTQMTVVDGPVCSDNSYFWYVSTPNGYGWVREGNTEYYFIDLLR